jgi:hypothetical protein
VAEVRARRLWPELSKLRLAVRVVPPERIAHASSAAEGSCSLRRRSDLSFAPYWDLIQARENHLLHPSRHITSAMT